MRTVGGQQVLVTQDILSEASTDDLLTVLRCDEMARTGYAWLQVGADSECWLPSYWEVLEELQGRGIYLAADR